MDTIFSTRRLATVELALPTLGFGCAPLAGMYTAADSEAAVEALGAALDAGICYFDTAPFYGFGKSERIVGDALRDHHHILSTKVGRLLSPGLPDNPASMGWFDPLPFHPVFDYTYDGIMRSLEDSLQRLGMERVQMLYVHDIGTFTHGHENDRHFADLKNSGFKALEKLRTDGIVRAIGIGVNEIEVCQEALAIGDWDVFLLAGRYTLLEQLSLEKLLPECVKAKTSIVIGGPFNSGILVGGDTWNYGTAPPDVMARVERLKAVADSHHVPLPAAALQFPLAHPAVVAVIPGLRTPDELASTVKWANTDISPSFWEDLRSQGLLHPNAPIPAENPFYKPS